MLSVLTHLTLPYAKAVMGYGTNPDALPSGWVKDDPLRARVQHVPTPYENTFREQMRTLYQCMDRYNEGKKPFQKVHLVLQESEADNICLVRHGSPFSCKVEGFGFLTRGKIHHAYFFENHEDIGFRVFEPGQGSHAYFRTYKATQEDFERFIDQAVFKRDKNPRLHF